MPNTGIGQPIVNTARGTANITPEQKVIDMSNEISLLMPRVSPLTVLTKRLNTNSTHNYRFDWMDDDMMARWASVAGAKVAGDTSVTLATGEGKLVAVNDLLKVVETGEVMRVTAVNGDAVTVQRGYGETSAGAIANNAKVLILGNANMQGSGASAEKYNNVVPAFNYTRLGCVA